MATTQRIATLSQDQVITALDRIRDTFVSLAKQAPVPLDWKREVGFAVQIIMRDDRLLQCDLSSIVNAVVNLAAVGLTLNPIKQQATIVARWNRDKRCYEAGLTIMYRGLAYLAGQAGVTNIVTDVVYSADEFSVSRTDQGDQYVHKINVTTPRDGVSNKFVGVYVAARMPGNKALPKVEWIPAEDIYAMRDQSDGYRDDKGEVRKNSPWVKWFDEMAKKSGLKRAQKRWEESAIDSPHWERLQQAVSIDNVTEGVIKPRDSDIVVEQDKQKLSMEQIAEIERLASEVWPSTELKPKLTETAITRICRAYKANALSEIDEDRYNEIISRIADARARVAS
jgi:recombination protein RecT